MSTHIIYHQAKPGIDCPDGIMAAAVAYGYHQGIGESVTVAGACYRKEYPPIPDIEIPAGTKKLVIVDFSYPEGWLLFWELQENLIVTVFEHHADKFGWLQDFSGAVLNDKECGASLVWQYYYGQQNHVIPEILEHVRRRDIGLDGYYEGRSPRSEAINLGLGLYRKRIKSLGTIEQLALLNSVIVDVSQSEIPFFLSSGLPEIEERDRLIADRLPKSTLAELDGIACGFYDFTGDSAIAPHYSILGHRIAKYHGVNLAWMVDGLSNHLRSTTPNIPIESLLRRVLWSPLRHLLLKVFKPKTTNCTAIAAAHGGGGHPRASGWKE
jgi:hypothetical protein